MPAVLRARQRQRPRQPRHAGRARRRRVRRQRPEDLDERRPVRPPSASSSPAPTPTRRSTRASRTSSARWTLPGIEIRPITEMTGDWSFNEVFFTDVRLPAGNLVGELNDGWRLAKVTLGNERISLSTGGVLWGNGPTALDLIDAAQGRRAGHRPDAAPAPRRGLHRAHGARADPPAHAAARLTGEQPGPEASIRKLLGDEHGQHVMELARDLVGAGGDADRRRPTTTGLDRAEWYTGFLFSPGADDRRRHRRGAAQHHRRAGPRAAARRRRITPATFVPVARTTPPSATHRRVRSRRCRSGLSPTSSVPTAPSDPTPSPCRSASARSRGS